MIRVHAIKTGDVIVKSAFLRSPSNSGGLLPYLANLFLDRVTLTLPVLAWVIEHPEGVIVVDTGTNATVGKNFVTQSRFEITPQEEIGHQLRQMGILPTDVSKVVLTHLHGDHIDGLRAFRHTPIWVSEREFRPFASPKGNPINAIDRIGITLPAWLEPSLIEFAPNPIGPFEQSYPLTRDGAVIAVPTPGHSAGHLSVIVIADGLHLFLAGDVTYTQAALLDQLLQGPILHAETQRDSLRRVLDYTAQFPTIYLPSHDPESVARLQASQTVMHGSLATILA